MVGIIADSINKKVKICGLKFKITKDNCLEFTAKDYNDLQDTVLGVYYG